MLIKIKLGDYVDGNAQMSGGAMLVLGIIIVIVIRLDNLNITYNWRPC